MKTASFKIRSVVLAGVAALVISAGSQMTARADNGTEGHGRRDSTRSIRNDLRRDEERLHRLECRLDDELRCHDFHAARETRREIDRVRDDIDRDRRELDRDYHDHDRGYGDYHRHE